MCLNGNKKIEEIFQQVAVQAYKDKMKDKKREGEDVLSFNELKDKIQTLSWVSCEDQYFGVIKVEKSNSSFCEWLVIQETFIDKNPTNTDKKNLISSRKKCNKQIVKMIKDERLKTIIIILESPHTDEFLRDGKTCQYIGPACGKTGRNLHSWLPEVILNYVPCTVETQNNYRAQFNNSKGIESGKYAVKLINAIQYQCSLGCDTVDYRDAVFSRMWNDNAGDVKKSLKQRLKAATPKVIINCCTKGNTIQDENDELRRLVQKEINGWYKDLDCLLLRAAHPSSYHFKNGLSLVDLDEA